MDAVRLEIARRLFASVAESMAVTLRRTAVSPNIKERRDMSSAVCDARGRMVAQGQHMPVHLGSMPWSLRAGLEALGPLGPGDVGLLNDPYQGGTHLPDLTLWAPVYRDGEPLFYVAVRAHMSDIGGAAPGSMPLARQVYEEGLRIPPVRLVREGRRDADLWRLILANVRTPEEREGDLAAMHAALETGRRRLEEITGEESRSEVEATIDALLGYGERMMRHALGQLPEGRWSFEDFLDDDGFGGDPVPIRLAVTLADGNARFDFGGSAPQVAGPVNAVEAVTVSCVIYVALLLAGEDCPANAGAFEPLSVVAPPGSVVNALPPAAVSGGNVETSQRIVDVCLGALAPALGERAPAASQGTMNNVALGGTRPETGEPWTYYETLGGGHGASARGPGLSGRHAHMTNSLNTPVEAMEHALPLRVLRYALRAGSGGAGRHRGGEGLVRVIEALAPMEASLLSQRRRFGPWGVAGGEPGLPGLNRVLRGDGSQETLGACARTRLDTGDVLCIETPGGGGWGEP